LVVIHPFWWSTKKRKGERKVHVEMNPQLQKCMLHPTLAHSILGRPLSGPVSTSASNCLPSTVEILQCRFYNVGSSTSQAVGIVGLVLSRLRLSPRRNFQTAVGLHRRLRVSSFIADARHRAWKNVLFLFTYSPSFSLISCGMPRVDPLT
jgi:hypothetical protein